MRAPTKVLSEIPQNSPVLVFHCMLTVCSLYVHCMMTVRSLHDQWARTLPCTRAGAWTLRAATAAAVAAATTIGGIINGHIKRGQHRRHPQRGRSHHSQAPPASRNATAARASCLRTDGPTRTPCCCMHCHHRNTALARALAAPRSHRLDA